MRSNRRTSRSISAVLAAVFVAASVTLLGPTAANAAACPGVGGTWQHGTTSSGANWYAYSYYLHGSKEHRASVRAGDSSVIQRSSWQPGGTWARATQVLRNSLAPGSEAWCVVR